MNRNSLTIAGSIEAQSVHNIENRIRLADNTDHTEYGDTVRFQDVDRIEQVET